MSYRKASTDDVDSVVPEEWGGMWFLRNDLGTANLGFTVMELEPGGKGKPHDHAGDGQEEVYCCVEGELTVELGDDTVTLAPNEALRVDPDQERQLFNRSDDVVKLVIASAPTELLDDAESDDVR